jgi:glutaconate CoA-transferase subunit B
MVVCGAREIKDGELALVGTGLPFLSALLAKKTHAPNAILMYESGVFDARPSRTPLSVMDPATLWGSLQITNLFTVFTSYLQTGYVDVGFIGGAQVDKYGNVNSTVIGDYFNPVKRFPGSGGAADFASLAKKVIIIMPHEKRRFVEKVDHITSPGYLDGPGARERAGLPRGGPVAVVSTMGVLRFDERTKEMYLDTYHPGVTIDQIKENTGWDLKISPNVHQTEPPTDEEIRIIRALDPEGTFLRREEWRQRRLQMIMGNALLETSASTQ